MRGKKFLSQWLCKGCCWSSINRTSTGVKRGENSSNPGFFHPGGVQEGWQSVWGLFRLDLSAKAELDRGGSSRAAASDPVHVQGRTQSVQDQEDALPSCSSQ